MTSNELQTFNFASGMELRSLSKDSEPWFIARDVANALGFADAHSAVQHLDSDEKANLPLEGFARGAIIVNESGLYSLILRSRKPEAKAFRKWVTGTVLPSLRKDGLYIAGQEKPITADLTLPELLAQMVDTQAKVDAIKAAKVIAWSCHQEEKEARTDALRFLRGKSLRIRT
jgi:anti-repressor protein